MFWAGSWFDFSQTFALAVDMCSVSVLQCKQLMLPRCSALVLNNETSPQHTRYYTINKNIPRFQECAVEEAWMS